MPSGSRTITTISRHQKQHVLFSSDPEKTESSNDEKPTSVVETPTTNTTPEEESAPYPIDLPSPLLLASSIILAIAGVGKFRRESARVARGSPLQMYYWV